MSEEFPKYPRRVGRFVVSSYDLKGGVVYELLSGRFEGDSVKSLFEKLKKFLESKYYNCSIEEKNYSCKIGRPFVVGFFEVKLLNPRKIKAIYSQLKYCKPNNLYFPNFAFDFKEFLKDLEEFLVKV